MTKLNRTDKKNLSYMLESSGHRFSYRSKKSIDRLEKEGLLIRGTLPTKRIQKMLRFVRNKGLHFEAPTHIISGSHAITHYKEKGYRVTFSFLLDMSKKDRVSVYTTYYTFTSTLQEAEKLHAKIKEYKNSLDIFGDSREY